MQTFSEDSALTVAMVLVNLKMTDAKHTLAVSCHVMLNLPDMPVSLVCENLVNKTVLLIHVVFMMRFICVSKMSVIFILLLCVKSLLYYIQLDLCVLTLSLVLIVGVEYTFTLSPLCGYGEWQLISFLLFPVV